MNEYLIPANSKRSQLIFNVFRPIDLIILVIGFCVSVFLLLLSKGNGVNDMIIKLVPVLVCGFLVVPIPFYHNVLVFITEMYKYLTKPSKYIWRGWCATYVAADDAEKK